MRRLLVGKLATEKVLGDDKAGLAVLIGWLQGRAGPRELEAFPHHDGAVSRCADGRRADGIVFVHPSICATVPMVGE